ncbi:metal ABC transporter substrate-binding protein [Nocardioides sp. GXQ0305]|uniref:metal ABC transporter substrate-binding protein n=1 Tax=Nocardioides sp. GXQ0305 TaxID=3423912 RepID=UPI003D7ECDD1
MSLVTRSRTLLAALLPSAVLLAGCGSLGADEGSEGREVVAAFYPLAWVTERVAGGDWIVSNLTAPGGEPHDLELSIDATARLSDADLVVHLDGFQPAVDDGIEANASGAVLDAGEVVGLQPLTDHDAHDHAESEPEDHDDHDHGDLDPHFWQDPDRMALLAVAVAEELGRLDEAHADDYTARAEQVVSDLEALDREYAEGLRDCERDVVVVSHDAFGYLGRYGLHLEPIAGLSPDAEPTPAALADLGDLIREEGVTRVFSERLASPAMAETLASDLGVGTGVLDPIEGLTDQTADEDYLSLMRANLAALEEANGC